MRETGIASRLFDMINISILLLFSLITIVPFIHVISSSFASVANYNESSFLLIPTEYSLKAYEYIFTTNALPKSLSVSVFITVAGTIINLLFTSLMAYSLSRKNVHFRN